MVESNFQVDIDKETDEVLCVGLELVVSEKGVVLN